MRRLQVLGQLTVAAMFAIGASATALAKMDHQGPNHGHDPMAVDDDDAMAPDDDDATPLGDDCAGLTGGAQGLCNAYCNAQDCPSHPDKHSCAVLRDNFERQTGLSAFPCDTGEVVTATASPSRTATAVPPSATPTDTPAATSTATATRQTATATSSAAATETSTAAATATDTPTGVPTGTTAAAGSESCTGLNGGAAGLCTAFCDAQDCPSHPDRHSCAVLRDNFERQTGSGVFPCETGAVTVTPTPGSDGDRCMGDCSGDGEVDISDLTQCMLIVLGERDAAECVHARHDGRMGIGDVVVAVRHALDGCQ